MLTSKVNLSSVFYKHVTDIESSHNCHNCFCPGIRMWSINVELFILNLV